MRLRILLLAGAMPFSIEGAHAQTAAATTPVPPPASSPNSAVPPSVEVGVPDIVVTAQKRSESSQKVPITLNVLSAQDIAAAAASSSMDLSRVVPGLVMNKSLGNGLVYLRGVGQPSGIVGGTESPVAIYIDGVYISSPAAGIFNLNNVDQVTVLKGPQGTLFGRNTTGGVIQVTTRDPGREAGGEAELGYGNYQTYTARASLSLPVADVLSTSFSGSFKRRDEGYVRNVHTGNRILDETSYTLQNKWVLEPSPRTKATLNLIYDRYDGGEGANYQVAPGYLARDLVTTYLGARTVNARIDGTNRSHLFLGSLKATQDIDWASITGIVALTSFKDNVIFSQTGTPGLPNPGNFPATVLRTPADIQTRTAELQIQSPDRSALKWIVGGFYLHDKNDYNFLSYNDEVFASSIHSFIYTRSYAFYAQATYPVLPTTRLTGGLRYTYDHKSIDGFTNTGATPSPTLPDGKSWKKLTWRLSVDQDVTSHVLAFASFNRGFKAGLYNATSFANPPVNPEVLDAYEVGFKSNLLGNRLRFNLTGFLYNYDGLQLRTSIQTPVVGVFTYNAAKARIKGLDAEVIAAVTPDLRLNFSGEYLHARYIDFRAGQFPILNPFTTVPAGCQPRAPVLTRGGVTPLTCDLTGNTLQRAPKFVGNFGIEYGINVPVGRLTFNVNDNYNSGYFYDPDNTLKQRAYHYVTASIRLTDRSERFSIKLWGSNLANEVIYGGGGFASTFYTLPAPPVMYGVTLGAKF